MGEHRASIKIEMEFHGIKDHTDMWINYFPQECCQMDARVVEFFDKMYRRGMEKYHANNEKYFAEQKDIEERKEFERLKKKYGDVK